MMMKLRWISATMEPVSRRVRRAEVMHMTVNRLQPAIHVRTQQFSQAAVRGRVGGRHTILHVVSQTLPFATRCCSTPALNTTTQTHFSGSTRCCALCAMATLPYRILSWTSTACAGIWRRLRMAWPTTIATSARCDSAIPLMLSLIMRCVSCGSKKTYSTALLVRSPRKVRTLPAWSLFFDEHCLLVSSCLSHCTVSSTEEASHIARFNDWQAQIINCWRDKLCLESTSIHGRRCQYMSSVLFDFLSQNATPYRWSILQRLISHPVVRPKELKIAVGKQHWSAGLLDSVPTVDLDRVDDLPEHVGGYIAEVLSKGPTPERYLYCGSAVSLHGLRQRLVQHKDLLAEALVSGHNAVVAKRLNKPTHLLWFHEETARINEAPRFRVSFSFPVTVVDASRRFQKSLQLKCLSVLMEAIDCVIFDSLDSDTWQRYDFQLSKAR
ncbi:hypothetical protein BDZ85DRAFT_51841 [Elsinoe ampelina]|uniref:Uncharacterized protein n=1 Tax=Elsinoe ampelina TaxID=302913 RepID=A0A6A6GMM1_9PEZI|nr:hypothetical protein BDZ85DRAFT_51841 [Elsinoe ampelina]